MKIVFLINSLSTGGAEKVLTEIANELVKKYEVEIIFLEKNEFYELNKKIQKTYLSNFKGNESGIKKLIYIPILAWKLKRYIKKNNIRIVQSHLFRANYINSFSKLIGSNHIVQLVTTGRVSRYKEMGFIGKINLFLVKHLYAKANLLISKSMGMKKDIEMLFNFKMSHIVINNPYNIRKIEKMAEEVISDFNFQKNKIYLISVGRLISLKRYNEIIELLPELDNNIELIILGEGPEKKKLAKLATKLKVKTRVHFLGQVKNPYKYMKRSNIFISCSESEGFPNVLVEAMICELPVISSDCISGPREILGPNKYGLLFDVGDKNKLLENINILLNDNVLRKQLVKKAKKRSYDFSMEKIVKKYKEILIENHSHLS